MSEKTILIADDDELIVDALRYQLEREGYRTVVAYDGEDALAVARAQSPDLILLDVMMPKRQGWEVCRDLRAESTVPILMLTARGEEMDRVLGLELGADDYIVKPFSFRELLARIHANLRRADFAAPPAPTANPERIQLGALTIDLDRYAVTRDGEMVNLSNREFDLLAALLAARGAVVKRGDLLDQVWGNEWIGDPRTLDVHIRWLREKI
ncbi:MAG: response regulator transcription factor, partial [Caldilineaceae bacterium]|nr:response regulator transcription factor [Caldilineaceae bacterium]